MSKYEISGTSTPSKTTVKWGLLRKNKKITARKKPKTTANACTFSPVCGIVRIDVCDYITESGTRWAYCKVNGKYGFILATSIRDYLLATGLTVSKVAKQVIDGYYGNDPERSEALKKLGYNPEEVQAEVNRQMKVETTGKKVRLYIPKFWENNQDKYFGDESIFIQYADDGKTIEKLVIFDTGMPGSLAVKKVQELGRKYVDAIVITHDHGDHMGLLRKMVDTFEVGRVYFPDQTGVRKYQKSYAERMDELEEYCKEKGVPVTYMKEGKSFKAGVIKVDCIFQADAAKLSKKDDHHFINNMSCVYKVTVDGIWTILIGGDLSKEGILQMMQKKVNYICDIFKFFWHSDRDGILSDFAKTFIGKIYIAYTQYHHKESKSNGRKLTHDLMRNAGAYIVRSCEEGAINMIMQGKTLTLKTASGISKRFTK